MTPAAKTAEKTDSQNGTEAADVIAVEPVNNDAASMIETQRPWVAEFELTGTCKLLFHRYDPEVVEEQANAPKGSKEKKSDQVDAYVYRLDPDDPKSEIGIPGVYVHAALIDTGRFYQDPRSKRKSQMDLLKAAIVPLTEVASLGTADWDFIDKRRVTVQRAAITRQRPGFEAGWTARFRFLVNLPEYVSEAHFQDLLTQCGRVQGLADFRPTYGRFRVTEFKRLELTDTELDEDIPGSNR